VHLLAEASCSCRRTIESSETKGSSISHGFWCNSSCTRDSHTLLLATSIYLMFLSGFLGRSLRMSTNATPFSRHRARMPTVSSASPLREVVAIRDLGPDLDAITVVNDRKSCTASVLSNVENAAFAKSMHCHLLINRLISYRTPPTTGPRDQVAPPGRARQ
jgi:hypothetical protein